MNACLADISGEHVALPSTEDGQRTARYGDIPRREESPSGAGRPPIYQRMSHSVIPAPVRFDAGGGSFRLGSTTTATCSRADVAPIVERFCSEITRRTGLRPASTAGHLGSGHELVRVEVATGDEFGLLSTSSGVSPAGGAPTDERYSLTIDADQIVVRGVVLSFDHNLRGVGRHRRTHGA
jgi:hypothetical protein